MYKKILKTCFDFSVALLSLVFFIPLFFFISLVVFILMGSPIFFKQERPGQNGRSFHLIKFRTMHQPKNNNSDVSGDNKRLTQLGRFLRASSLDELPELWNVLKGDMSLVGPRPLLMQYLDRYTPEQARRHDVKPGITGWAQINGRNSLSWEDKFELDVWYVDNVSFWLDIKILFLTVLKVFKREGISQEGHATMPEFMGSDAV